MSSGEREASGCPIEASFVARDTIAVVGYACSRHAKTLEYLVGRRRALSNGELRGTE